MAKFKKMALVLDEIAIQQYGRSRSQSIRDGVCVSCESVVDSHSFTDDLSAREYTISGLCQKCQDETFGSDI